MEIEQVIEKLIVQINCFLIEFFFNCQIGSFFIRKKLKYFTCRKYLSISFIFRNRKRVSFIIYSVYFDIQ